MPRSDWRLPFVQRFLSWRDHFADRLPEGSTVGKVGSPDLHQAKMRFLVLVGCVTYGVSIGIFDEGLTRAQASIFGLDALLFGLFALHTHAYFKRDPKPNYPRRTIGLFADHAAALACLAVTGRDVGALAWLPLFIIQGVGIRFGVRWLYASQAIGVVSVGVICAVNPFFRENATVGLGAILSVLVLPLYFALLAKREARIKDALQQARLDAEDANAAKGRFVAMISHELRTPLTGISGLNELLRKQDLPVHAQQFLAEQCAATSLMLTMVNDILDLSKIEDGAVQLQEVDFDPQQLALSVLQGLSFQAKQKGLVVYTELDASLPVAISGSPFHVSRILQNLLGNAIKFTSEGSVTLRVRRGEDTISNTGALTVRFDVIDTGIGIPAAALPRIFDRFYQVDAAITRRFGGTGLGTSLVKEFCDLLKGSVRIDSQLGEGTKCYVALPFKPAQASNDAKTVNAAGAEVAAWTEGIVGWPRIKAQLVASGISVREVTEAHHAGRNPAHAGKHAAARQSVLLLGGYPSSRARTALAAMGPTNPTYILLRDLEAPTLFQRGSSGVAILAGSDDGSIARAVRLALLETPYGQLGAIGRPENRRPAALRVLLAEDSPTVQLVMRATLENAGFAVAVAHDGKEALCKATSTPYDVIVLDWNMPHLDGIEVLRRLRSESGANERTPVIIATAAPSPQLVEQAMAAGARSVLGKPFAGDEFVLVVNDAARESATRAPAVAAKYAASGVRSSEEVTLILDVEALESPGSIFRTADAAKFVAAFTRDVAEKRGLFQQALATADLSLFRTCIHSLTGYAGVFGARRLEWLLSTAPHDDIGLKAVGPKAVADLCESMNSTAIALDEWSKSFLCPAQ